MARDDSWPTTMPMWCHADSNLISPATLCCDVFAYNHCIHFTEVSWNAQLNTCPPIRDRKYGPTAPLRFGRSFDPATPNWISPCRGFPHVLLRGYGDSRVTGRRTDNADHYNSRPPRCSGPANNVWTHTCAQSVLILVAKVIWQRPHRIPFPRRGVPEPPFITTFLG